MQGALSSGCLFNDKALQHINLSMHACAQDALELSKRNMAPEEVELLDVERQMEEELVDEFKQVERIIAMRVDPVEGDQRFLVKVRLEGFAIQQISETTCEAELAG